MDPPYTHRVPRKGVRGAYVPWVIHREGLKKI